MDSITSVSDSFLLISSHPVKNDMRKLGGQARSSSDSSILSLHFVKFSTQLLSWFPTNNHTVHTLMALIRTAARC